MHCPHCHHEIMDYEEIQRIVRQELMHLDADVAARLTAQITSQISRTMRAQGTWRTIETKQGQRKDS